MPHQPPGFSRRKVLIGAAAVVGATAVVDAAGWDPLGTSFAGGRVGGLFGQPIVLATVSLLLLPLVVGANRLGVARWPVAASLVAAIVVSQSRGSLVGLLALAAVTGPVWWPRARARPRRAALVGAAALAALAVILLITPFGERLEDATASSRLDEWWLAARVAAANPLTGVAPEGYRIAVLDELDVEYVEAYGRAVVIDRAHSSPLDVAVSGGGLAAGAYVVLVAGAAVSARRLHRSDPTGLPAAAGAGAVAVFAAGLVAFPVPEVDAVAWLFAGIAVAAAEPLGRRTGPRHDRASGPMVRIGLRAAGVGLTAVTAVAGVTDVVVDHHLDDALAASRAGRHESAVDHAEHAVGLRGDQVDSFYVAAQVAAAGPTILDLDEGVDWVESGLARFPSDPALRDLRVELLVERALRSELPADVDTARAAIEDLLSTDPTSVAAQSGTRRLTEACVYRCENKP